MNGNVKVEVDMIVKNFSCTTPRSSSLCQLTHISLCSIVLLFTFSGLFLSCYIDYTSFNDENADELGYKKDEIEMFSNFGRLATKPYKWKEDGIDHFQSIHEELQYDVKTKIIEYASRYHRPRDSLDSLDSIRSSASLMYPDAPAPKDGWPLFITLHHTVVEDSFAPSAVLSRNQSFSLDSLSGFDPHLHPLLLAASTGFAIYQPDYVGLGASRGKMHPFMYSNSLIPDVLLGLDAAIKKFEELGISINKEKVVVAGFSHGAWVANHVYRELNANPKYSSKYHVVAGVSSAGVYDVQSFLSSFLQQEKTSLEAFIPYTIHGYKKVGIENIVYKEIYNEPHASYDFDDLFSGKYTEKHIDNLLDSVIAKTYTPNFIHNHGTDPRFSELWEQLRKDSIAPWKLSGKLYVVHHEKDALIPIDQVRTFIDTLEAVPGQTSENIEEYIGEWGDEDAIQHESTAVIHYIVGLNWLLQFL